MPEEAPLLDAPEFDVDGQATVTSGTWSFDCSIAAVMQSEISIAPGMNSISIAPMGFEFSASLISIAASATKCNWNYNLLETETYEWTPYAIEDSTVYVRQTFIGDKDKGGGRCIEEVYGNTTQVYDKKESPDEIAYSRTVIGDTAIASRGKYDLSAKHLELSSDEQVVIRGTKGIQLKDGKDASIEVKDGRFSGTNLTEFACQATGNMQVTSRQSINLLATTKINMDATTAGPPEEPPKQTEAEEQKEAAEQKDEQQETAEEKAARLADRNVSQRLEGFFHKGWKVLEKIIP